MLKRILAVALAAAMILGLAGVALAASPFPDTEGIPEEVDISRLKTLGLVKGDDFGYFRPGDTITRAEFCAMIVRALGLENAASYLATPTQFPDVKANVAWAYGYINVAVTKGVIKGYPDGTFKPSDPVSEAEALTMVMRALGYKDSLPGDWPLDYIMKGAEDAVGLVKSGFVPSTSATRAFVAVMIGNMLGAHLVKEDADIPGYFTNLGIFQEVVLNVSSVVSGVVSDVNSTTKTLKIGGVSHTYADSVVIAGAATSVSGLTGYTVDALAKAGKIIFIATSNVAVSGKVVAVDVINKTLTIGEKAYPVTDGFGGTKNAIALGGSIQNMLVSLLDCHATLWLDSNGKAYKAEARWLDNVDAVVTSKTVKMTPAGTRYYLGIGATDYELDSDATVSKNGVAVGWSDIAQGDLVSFALEKIDGIDKIVWVDAWSLVVEMAQVNSKYDLGSAGKQIVVTVGGESKTYTCTTDGFDAVLVGDYYNLKINRDGKVYGADKKTSSVTTGVGVIDRASTEFAWVDGQAKTYYKVTLKDGTVIDLPYSGENFTFKFQKDNGTLLDPTASSPTYLKVADFATTFKVGASINVSRSAGLVVSEVKLYSSDFAGLATYSSGVLTVGGNTVPVASGCVVTLDGVVVPVSLLNNVGRVRVTWDAAEGEAVKLEGVEFVAPVQTAGSAVTSIASKSDGSYDIVIRAGGADGTTVTAPKTAVVVKDGAASSLGAIALGDKIQYTSGLTYIEAKSDTKAPALADIAKNPSASYDSGTKKVTVTVTFNEEVQEPTVYVEGVEGVVETASTDGKVFTVTSAQTFDSDPVKVSAAISVKDFAGNVFNVTKTGIVTE